MALRRESIDVPFDVYFEAGRFMVVGGVATRAYQPERFTKSIDVLVVSDSVERVRARFAEAGGCMTAALFMPDSALGLEGEAWSLPIDGEIDLLWSSRAWVAEAFSAIGRDETGMPIAKLAFLVLMKLDASRSVDQGDLARMLGLANDAALDETRAVVTRYLGADAALDLESYIELGRLEVGRG